MTVAPASRPDLTAFPARPTTRFAPAPTGFLHLGHVANAIHVWGLAGALGGRVVLRIEDHDRQRCRPAYETALLDDLVALGLRPDEPAIASLRAGPSPFRQSDSGAAYATALESLGERGLAYACACTRATFERCAIERGRPFDGPGCPGDCRVHHLRADEPLDRVAGVGVRVALGDGAEGWHDLLAGDQVGRPSATGDFLARDRHDNWTYGFAVVVDDLRHGIDLVVRGRDLLAATPAQIRLGRLLGRPSPPAFAHHPLVRKSNGAKLSKADADTAVRELVAGGTTPAELFGAAAAAVGLVEASGPIEPAELARLFGAS